MAMPGQGLVDRGHAGFHHHTRLQPRATQFTIGRAQELCYSGHRIEGKIGHCKRPVLARQTPCGSRGSCRCILTKQRSMTILGREGESNLEVDMDRWNDAPQAGTFSGQMGGMYEGHVL